MAQLEPAYSKFEELGARLIIIAAQKIEGWFRGKEHVHQKRYPFPLLFDETRQVTRAYGVYQRIGKDGLHIAHPATFIVGRDGRISWIGVSPNQFERPTPADMLDVIRGLA